MIQSVRERLFLSGSLMGVLVASAILAPELALAQQSRLRDVIDREIKAGWEKEKLAPPGLSSDAVFLRRIYLDLIGMIPSYEEATAFLGDADPQKREKLVEKLLADPRYARQQAQVFDVALLTRNHKVVEGTVGYRNRGRFRQWLAKQFESNEPYDRIAAKILQAQEDGSQLYFAVYNGTDEMVTAVSRFFLGRQIQCAKCHDHPYESWTQKDYHGLSGFFVRTMSVEVPEKPEIANQKGKHYLVGEKAVGEAMFSLEEIDPKTKKKVTNPVRPKFLSGEELTEPEPPKDYVEPKLKPGEVPPKTIPSSRRRWPIVSGLSLWGAASCIRSTTSTRPTRRAIPSCSRRSRAS
jgi:hypothetical protein